MAYNRRTLLEELDVLISREPRLPLSEIARRLGVDRHTLASAMLSGRNISFREYKRRMLLQMVKEMLDHPHMSIKEVGINLGYTRPASFSRFVQKATGKSPSQLRE